MSIFLTLLAKLLPLYGLILLGYIAGRFFRVKKEIVAFLLLYVIGPVIFFNGIYTSHLNAATLSLPLLFFALCSIICLLFLFIGRYVWKDEPVVRHIYAFMTGEANMGYFGLPVIAILLGNNALSLAILCILGYSFYESTVGYFIAARGQYSARESARKLLLLPALYAVLLGVIAHIAGWHLGHAYVEIALGFKWALTVLGMMLVGLAVSNFKELELDFKFVTMGFIAKFAVWPALMGLIILLDSKIGHIYNPEMHKVMFLLSIVPIAANSVVFATSLRAHPEKVSVAVLASTLFALLYIPLLAVLFLS